MEPTVVNPTIVSLPWLEVAKLAVSTGVFVGVFSALVTKGMDWLMQRSQFKTETEKNARYLAARIAVTLEQFALKCADWIADNEAYSDTRGSVGQLRLTLPLLAEFPSDAHWTAVDPALVSRSLSMSNELMLAKATIDFAKGIADPEDHFYVCNAFDRQAGKCGYRAWQLAKDLRRKYALGEFSPKEFSWNSERLLNSKRPVITACLRADACWMMGVPEQR